MNKIIHQSQTSPHKENFLPIIINSVKKKLFLTSEVKKFFINNFSPIFRLTIAGSDLDMRD